MRLKLALALMGALAVIAVSGASAADFDDDDGPCLETPGEAALLRCPTGYVGAEYEIEIVSEEGSGCREPVRLLRARQQLASAWSLADARRRHLRHPHSAGFTRFWLWDRDLTFAQGGPDWCQREDKSEREFSIYIDPGLAIENESLKGPTIGQSYSETLTAKQVVTLNPPTGSDVQAMVRRVGGASAGSRLSPLGLLTGTPTTEGSWGFVIRAQNGSNSIRRHMRSPSASP